MPRQYQKREPQFPTDPAIAQSPDQAKAQESKPVQPIIVEEHIEAVDTLRGDIVNLIRQRTSANGEIAAANAELVLAQGKMQIAQSKLEALDREVQYLHDQIAQLKGQPARISISGLGFPNPGQAMASYPVAFPSNVTVAPSPQAQYAQMAHSAEYGEVEVNRADVGRAMRDNPDSQSVL